jgi:CelD/BcsL family acetyltransferase involved in cellulose biosynthesis
VVFQISVENSFDFLSPEYADLFSRSDATVFQHPYWLDRLYARLVPYRNAKPLVITVRSPADGELLMVIPLVRRKQGGIKLVEFADLQVSDYIAPIGSSASLQRILNDQAACKAIREKLAPYDLLRLQKLTDGSVGLEPLFGAKPRALMPMSSYPVPLLHSYDQWCADYMDRSYRKELHKKKRQLDRKGTVRFECCDNPKVIEATFGAMREFRRLRFSDDDLLQQEAYFEFYLEIAIKGSAMGLARTYVLSVDDRPVAGVLGLSHKHELAVILGGFDLAGFKKQSIGSIAFQEVAKDGIAKGDICLDFTIGDEPYKRLFGAKPASMWAITAPGSHLGMAAGFLLKQLPWIKAVSKRLERPLATSPN